MFKNTHKHEMLKLASCNLGIKIRILIMTDNLEMTDYHRNIILKKCKNSKKYKIVITHGTDTITRTVKSIGE